MLPIRPAIQSAREGMMRYSRDVDRAAQIIANSFEQPDAGTAAGTTDTATTPQSLSQAAAQPPDFLDGMVTLMLAQRAFTAQLRVFEAADQMAQESVNLGRR